MKIIRSAKQFQKTLERERGRGRTIGFVPTMGALHAGHLALVHEAIKKNDITAVSIFVNPAQFGPNEDFNKYPRVLNQDARLLRRAGVNYLFYPAVEEIYPEGCSFSVKLDSEAGFAKGLCGRFRPGHFEGVATVVAKLFNLSGACRAYFGAKDYQQTVVIRNLVKDLLLPVQIVVRPTVREKDGLAMSSRNRYLNSDERKRAAVIYQALSGLKYCLENPSSSRLNLKVLKKQAVAHLEREGLVVQYFEIVDAETLLPAGELRAQMVAAAACFCGKTRLIDNAIIRIPQKQRTGKTNQR